MRRAESPKQEARKRFNKNFKQEAVELWRQSGKTGAEIAAELGIRANNLYNWAKGKERAEPASPNASSATDLATENAALRRENERLRQQRDILKKTLGILSEPPNSATTASSK
jgi:transposase